MIHPLDNLRKEFQNKPIEQRQNFLKSLSKDELQYLYETPNVFLFDKQIIPDGDWRYYILQTGRSFGKNFSGAAWIATKIRQGAKALGLCGAKYGDVTNEMVPAIRSWFTLEENEHIHWNGNYHVLRFDKFGATVKCYSSDTQIRGPNLEYCWADEVVKWADEIQDKQKECFDNLDLTVRVGKNPQILVTSTPKPFKLFLEWKKKAAMPNSKYVIQKGSMFDNPFLSKNFIDAQVAKHGSSRFGRQELYGDLLEDNPLALWSHTLIDKNKISEEEFQNKLDSGELKILITIVAVDPAVTSNKNSDLTGICVASLCSDGKVYIRYDLSGAYTPNEWQTIAARAYHSKFAARIILESNNGGDLVDQGIKTMDQYIRTKLIHATVGKKTRFEPVVSAYEQGKVVHVGDLMELEDEMVGYDPIDASESPDRADAMAYAVYELLLQRTTAFRDCSALGRY